MSSNTNSPELSSRKNSVDSCLIQEQNYGKTEDSVNPTSETTQVFPLMNESTNLAAFEERTAASPNPSAPSILIDNCEEEPEANNALATAEADVQSDHSGLTNSGAEMKQRSSDQDEVDTESEAAHHHSRLLRLLSGELCDGPSGGEAPTSTPSASETEANFLPPDMPGVRLRVRSLRAKDRIPSRVFRSLQHEFDSSTEDIVQAVVSSPPPLSIHQTGQLTSSTIGSNFFRYSRLYASVTPETPSSATSELEGFFPSQQNPFH